MSKHMNEVQRAFSSLESEGFHRKGKEWTRRSRETVVIVNLQKADWANAYYVNFAAWLLALKGEPPNPLREAMCHLRARLGKDLGRTALNLEFAMDSEERLHILKNLVKKWVIPLANQCTTLRGCVATACEQPAYFWLLQYDAPELLGSVTEIEDAMAESKDDVLDSFCSLQDEGFHRKGTRWTRRSNETIVLVELQKSSRSNAYHLNCGVWLLNGGEPPGPLWTPMCHLRARLGDPDHALDLDCRIDPTERRRILKEMVVPLANQCTTVSGCVATVREKRSTSWALRGYARELLGLPPIKFEKTTVHANGECFTINKVVES